MRVLTVSCSKSENVDSPTTLPITRTTPTYFLHRETPTVNLRIALKTLLALVLGLPILSVVLTWVTGLLAAMGDAGAATVLGYINIASRVIWLVSLVGIVVVLGLESLDRYREE